MRAARLDGLLVRVPLAGSYPAAVTMALLALSPFIVVSSASLLLGKQIIADLGTGTFGVGLAGALANASYAFGAVAAADLINRIPKRRLFVCSEVVFALASVLCAVAPDIVAFTVGRTLEGLSTGLLLVVALPPLVTAHGAGKLPLTAAFVNVGLFGMVTAGPLVGGVIASESSWRILFLLIAALGALGAAVGVLAFEGEEGLDPRIGFDYSAIPVAAAATVLPFLGVSWLTRGSFTSPGFFVPLALGLAALATLLVRQYRKEEALMPLKLISHTLPVTGIAVAMVAGAAFTALVELSVVYLLMVRHQAPIIVGAVLGAQILGVVVAAWLFKAVLASRWLPVLAFSGLGVAVVGGALLLLLSRTNAVPVIAVAGLLLGFGAGAGVSPGLFMAGLSVPSNRLGPTFALVELLRSEAAFLVAPVLLAVAMNAADPAHGIRMAVLITVIGAGVPGLVLLGLLLLGGVKPHAPDLQGWLDGEGSAFSSRPLAAAVRRDAE